MATKTERKKFWILDSRSGKWIEQSATYCDNQLRKSTADRISMGPNPPDLDDDQEDNDAQTD